MRATLLAATVAVALAQCPKGTWSPTGFPSCIPCESVAPPNALMSSVRIVGVVLCRCRWSIRFADARNQLWLRKCVSSHAAVRGR
jgi:hypothetical protein